MLSPYPRYFFVCRWVSSLNFLFFAVGRPSATFWQTVGLAFARRFLPYSGWRESDILPLAFEFIRILENYDPTPPQVRE